MKRQEKGQALILALVLLGVGSLVLVPLLGLMSDGLNAGVIVEQKTDELYAADAGVQDAIWKIKYRYQITEMPRVYGDPPLPTYYIDPVNGYKVTVDISCINNAGGGTYRVISKVIATADGRPILNGTKIEAIVATVFGGYYSGITDHVIISQGDIDVNKKVNVVPSDPNHPNGPKENYAGLWPPPGELKDWYSQDVANVSPYTSGSLDAKNYPAGIGRLYRDGTLSIINTGAAGLTLKLNGTVYITGDTLIGTTNQDFTLDLNGNTIFVESDTLGISKYALNIGGKCTLTGSGCIIAVGNIKLEPKFMSSPEHYILVMSVIGTTYMQPSGTFYGTLAGSIEVEVQQGTNPYIQWTKPDMDGDGIPDVNFPGWGGGRGMVWGIFTWEIS